MRQLNRLQDVGLCCFRLIVLKAIWELAVETPAVIRFEVAYNSIVAGLNLDGRVGRQIQQRRILQNDFGVFQILLLDVRRVVVED